MSSVGDLNASGRVLSSDMKIHRGVDIALKRPYEPPAFVCVFKAAAYVRGLGVCHPPEFFSTSCHSIIEWWASCPCNVPVHIVGGTFSRVISMALPFQRVRSTIGWSRKLGISNSNPTHHDYGWDFCPLRLHRAFGSIQLV